MELWLQLYDGAGDNEDAAAGLHVTPAPPRRTPHSAVPLLSSIVTQ